MMSTTDKLAPCPFCGEPLTQRAERVNPHAECRTENCYGARMPVVNLDDPTSIEAWNRRASQSTPVEVTADAEGAFLKAWEASAGLSRHDQLQAALAAAFPALVQQVERLNGFVKAQDEVMWNSAALYQREKEDARSSYNKLLEKHNALFHELATFKETHAGCMGSSTQQAKTILQERDTLSAANAQLAKDAERLAAEVAQLNLLNARLSADNENLREVLDR